MATFEPTRTAPFGAIAVLKAVQFFEGAWLRVSEWNQIRITRQALSRLSDRELEDIGLCRGDIELIGTDRKH